jgi:hypothetical protein
MMQQRGTTYHVPHGVSHLYLFVESKPFEAAIEARAHECQRQAGRRVGKVSKLAPNIVKRGIPTRADKPAHA